MSDSENKVTYERAVEVADTYMQAMSTNDFATVMTLYAQNATLEDPVGSEIKQGWAAIKDFYFGIKGTDLTCTRTGKVRFSANEMVFPFDCVMRSDDGTMKVEIIDHFVLNDDGLIKKMRAFWGAETTSFVNE